MASVLHRTTKQYIGSANTPDFPTQDWIINPDLSAVVGFAAKYWVISGDSVSLMSQGERDAVDAAAATALKDSMAANVDAAHPAELRALVELLVDELNAHSEAINAILTAIDNGANLSGIKTAIAAISDLPTRTLQQAKNAIRTHLDG